MASAAADGLSRRERQIMDIIYRRGRASVSEVLVDMPDPPSDSAARALLRILEKKGHVRREEVAARRYVFSPAGPRDRAARSALKRVLSTFFDDSAGRALVALLDVSDAKLPQGELDRFVRLIEKAREEGR